MSDDQIQSVDNDLQKAIDNITNTTNIDPVFSDPVAVPEPIIPLPNEPSLEEPTIPATPEPVAPAPAPEPIAPPTPIAEPIVHADIPELPVPTMNPEPDEIQPSSQITTEITTEETSSIPDLSPVEKISASEVKKAALRDLAPLLNRLDMEPTQKFSIYRDIFEDLQDCTILDSAYKAAREIPDETKRAEALLYLIESIDKM
ncbi:MAG: hypothetical protein Q4F61_00365 [Candidatus Saccharibacteria bacterium]|nr:hypothetical protein [Candidatus Saccharibacteria bacterium]